MSESFVQLPPNSTGIEIRVISGDGNTNLLPSGVTEEVTIPSDAQGLLAGDARQQSFNVQFDQGTLRAILDSLQRIEFILKVGLDVDIRHDDMLLESK